jgi:sugar phosphate isomerase/epimerase
MNRRAVRYVASTYSFLWRRDLAEAVEAVANAGFTSVEILAAAPHVSLPAAPDDVRQLRRVCEELAIGVNSVVPSGIDVNLASTDSAMRDWSAGQFVAAMRLAAELNAPYVIVHPGRRHPLRPPPLRVLRAWVLDGLAQVTEQAAVEGVGVLVENSPTGLLDTAKDCVDLVQEIGGGNLGLCYDVANGHMVEDVLRALRLASTWLRLVHASDTTRKAWAHDPIGAGELDFPRIGRVLAELDYGGPVVLETLHDDVSKNGLAHDAAQLQGAGWGRPMALNRR